MTTEAKPKYARRTLIINRQLQYLLIGYGLCTGLLCLATASFFYKVVVDRYQTVGLDWLFVIPMVMLFFLTSALIVVLGMVVSNRVAGPLYRIQRELLAIREGRVPQKIVLRKGDLLTDVVEDFNQTISHLSAPPQ